MLFSIHNNYVHLISIGTPRTSTWKLTTPHGMGTPRASAWVKI